MNKIDKTLARVTNKKRKTQILKIEMKEGTLLPT